MLVFGLMVIYVGAYMTFRFAIPIVIVEESKLSAFDSSSQNAWPMKQVRQSILVGIRPIAPFLQTLFRPLAELDFRINGIQVHLDYDPPDIPGNPRVPQEL